MRRGGIALLLAFSFLSLPGCDEDGSGKKSADPPATAAADVRTANAPASDTVVADAVSPTVAALKDQKAAASAPAATDETLAAGPSTVFDGSRSDGKLSTATPAVTAGPKETWRSAPKLQPNAAVRKISLDAGGGVPSPNTLPTVNLPSETEAQASAGAKGGGPVLLAFDAFQKALQGTIYPVFSRKAWGAAPAKFESYHQTPTRVTVHHTDGAQYMDADAALAYVRTVQAMHMNPNDPKHNWDDIGYHFLIDGAGRVYEGRHTDIMGAHAKGANENNVGISLMGDYNRDKPTVAEIDSLRRLVTFLALKYRTDPRQGGFIEPHKHYNNTDCPGNNVVAILGKLNADVDSDTLALAARFKSDETVASTAFVPLVVTQPPHA